MIKASLLFLLFLLATPKAWSACTTPNGVAGTLDYFTGTNDFQYCDGTNWVSLGSAATTSSVVAGWPDAITCTNGQGEPWVLYNGGESDSSVNIIYEAPWDNSSAQRVLFSTSTNLIVTAPPAATGCSVGTALSTMISNGQAKFFGNDIAAVNSDDDGDTKIYTEQSADEDKIRFDTAGSERMIIDSNGRVGIKTSAPISDLQVYGRGVFQTTTTYGEAQNVYDTVDVWGNVYGNNQNGAIAVHAQDSGDVARWSTRLAQKSNGSGSPRASIDVIQRDASNVVTSSIEALSILHQNGNVGVSTSAPAATLHVEGSMRFGGFTTSQVTKCSKTSGAPPQHGANHCYYKWTGGDCTNGAPSGTCIGFMAKASHGGADQDWQVKNPGETESAQTFTNGGMDWWNTGGCGNTAIIIEAVYFCN